MDITHDRLELYEDGGNGREEYHNEKKHGKITKKGELLEDSSSSED